jgi:hypothetical protein
MSPLDCFEGWVQARASGAFMGGGFALPKVKKTLGSAVLQI